MSEIKEKIKLEVCLGFGTVELEEELEISGMCIDDKMELYMDIWFMGAAV